MMSPEQLNPEQQRAVLCTNGPARVLAGPGSGKTLVIVEKVAKLVSDGISQESILCMTFTEKAADVMRHRLHKRDIDNVWVGTMHSLCLEILKDNSLATGITEKTVILSSMARLAWCVQNIDRFDIDNNIIKLDRNPKKACDAMLRAIRLAQREMITPSDIDDYIQNKTASNPKDDEKLLQLTELAKVYHHYDVYKKEKDLIDYEDMISMAVNRLTQNESMLARYRKKFQYVLVDEFQDNNYAQFLLAKLLAGSSGNITVVGDDDQSIMGFQGAFDGIFTEFNDTYKGNRSVHLVQNYRCSENISETSLQVLRADKSRKTKKLYSKKGDGDPVMLVAAINEAAERRYVAETILDMDISYGDIAVLCRTNESCQRFAETLRSAGIPVDLVGVGNIMRNAIISEILALLKIADSPHTSGVEISHMLKTRGIREYNIGKLNSVARYQKRTAHSDGVFSALLEHSGSDQDEKIREITDNFQKMIDEAKSAGILDMLHKIMTEYTDAYKKYSDVKDHNSARNISFLNALYEMAKDYGRHYPRGRLSDFIKYLDFADDSGMTDLESGHVGVSDAVTITTIHKSKGKEFDAVFVTGTYNDNMPSKFRSENLDVPSELLKGTGRIRDPKKAHMYEQRNLLYVAMTRAKNKLYLTYPKQSGDNRKEKTPSVFLTEIKYGDNPRIRAITYEKDAHGMLAPKDVFQAEKSRIQAEACKAIRESRLTAAVRSIVQMAQIMNMQQGMHDDFDARNMLDVDVPKIDVSPPKIRLINKNKLTLSATDIQTYQQCPLKFKYRRVLRIPEKPNIYMTRGSAIHNAIEQLTKAKLEGNDLDTDSVMELVNEEVAKVRGMHPEPLFRSVKYSLDDIMKNYTDWESESPNSVIGAEVKVNTIIDGIPYRGKIDRVEVTPDKKYVIVDFKTGKTPISKNKLRQSPQANIYAAAAKAKYGSLPVRVSFVFLGGKTQIRDYTVTQESLDAGLDIIKECAKGIVKEEFPATPGYHCNSCPYRGFCPMVITK